MNPPPNPPTAGEISALAVPRRIAVYRLGDEPKSLVARLTLMSEAETSDQIQVESESQEIISMVRDILQRAGDGGSDGVRDPALLNERRIHKWTRILEELQDAGFGVEDISSGDYQLQFEISTHSGFQVGMQQGLHDFSGPNDALARKIAEAMAGPLEKIPNDLAREINAAVAAADDNAIISTLKHGKESGSFGVRPTLALLDALVSIDIATFNQSDRRLVRECRLVTAQILRRTEIAGPEADALLREAPNGLDDRQKAELEMIIAHSEAVKGHPETAMLIWRRLLKSPDVLGPGSRGWAWRNISMALPMDDPETRSAARCSVDAFLEAGQKDEACKSLMMLANSLLSVKPQSALDAIDEIIALIDQNGLQNRELKAATYHARANRLAQLGQHREAAADALKAAELRRGLVGVEEGFISSLHLAAVESDIIGDIAAAEKLRREASDFSGEVNSPHFTLAERVVELSKNFDGERANDLLEEAHIQANKDVVAAVRVIQATQDETLSDYGRLSLLEDTLRQLDVERARGVEKAPARIALATLLFKLDQPERERIGADRYWQLIPLTASPAIH
jgi:hypothetical protein